MALGSIQPLTEMSTSISWRYRRPVPKADITTVLCRCHEILTSWNPLGLPRPVTGLLYFYLYQRTGSVTITMTKWCKMFRETH